MTKPLKHALLAAPGSEPTRTVANTFFTKILTNDLLFELIFSSTSPGTLLRLSRTCKRAKAAVQSYFLRAFNINKHLSRFFNNPLEFRSLQARTATLVSGSSALQFFNRLAYSDSDLDLYTYRIHGLEVGNWLLQNGYTFQPQNSQPTEFNVAYRATNSTNGTGSLGDKYDLKGVAGVFTFVKTSPVNPFKKLQVQVVVATYTPMEVILNFHSTVVLNVIAWDRAYSLYPRATFEDRRALYMRSILSPSGGVIQKYQARGWKFCFSLNQLQQDKAFNVARWIGDGHSWVIKLDTEGVTLPPPVTPSSTPLNKDPCRITSWVIDRKLSANAHRPQVSVQRHSALFYTYVSMPQSWTVVLKEIEGTREKIGRSPVEKYLDQEMMGICELKNIEMSSG
ncbi:hypothetical protein BC629DRAFT_156478 [Irpex lacteus]|nr:hypothetical protein BC629DRAFT_156478 [Irpex lacteus]